MISSKFIVPRKRKQALAPVYWNTVLHTDQSVKKIYGQNLSLEYFFMSKGQMNTIVLRQEWNKIGNYIVNCLIKEKKYFKNIEKNTERAKQKILSFIIEIKKKNLSKSSFSDLINFASKIKRLFMEYDAASVFIWFVAGDILKQKIGTQLKISGNDLDILTLPKEQTFVTQMEREVITAALKNQAIKKVAQNLVRKYYWMPFGYDGSNIWDEIHFKQRIKKYQANPKGTKIKYYEIIERDRKLKQKLQKLLEIKKFSNEEKHLLHILRSSVAWTDERKMLDFQLFFWYQQILLEFAQRYNISVANLKYLFTSELKDLDKNYQALKIIAKRRARQEFMIISTKGNIRLASKIELKKIKKIIKSSSKKDDISGQVACRGPKLKYIAPVKILHSSQECSRVKSGEILVTSMTTPDYILAMDRALGFITDEGGVTCHAAIVAREMNKPCIIGTGNATQLLKNGDKIELDVLKGFIKIKKRGNKR